MARKLLVVLVVLVGCGSASGVASATTTSLYYDGFNNLLASPDLFANPTHGEENTGTGRLALTAATTAPYNTADGYYALNHDTSGSYNTATGAEALPSNETGTGNVADGLEALYDNVSGSDNTATGTTALFHATSSNNVADGYQALTANVSGGSDTATGTQALQSATSSSYDVADGFQALQLLTTGSKNLASGVYALAHDKTGSYNVGEGYAALYKTTGSTNTALGYHAGFNLSSGHDNVAVANLGVAGESGVIRIGTVKTQTKAFLAGVNGVTIPGPAKTVLVNAQGQLGTAVAAGLAAKAHSAAVGGESRPSAVTRLRARLRRQQHEIDQLAAAVHALQAHR